MSMYQQQMPQPYGQVSYPPFQHQPASYPPQPGPAYGYGYPPFDASSFRREYSTRLSELTMNSRPIIHNLSMMAQNFTRYADIVADCLQAHIRRVPAWMKLPALYVLDAISKNVNDPYAAKFSAFVVPLFLEAYSQVDAQTRGKMEEMLVTWRTGSPSGTELFGIAAQVSLERQIWGQETPTDSKPRRRGQPPPSPLNKSQVLAELDVTLARKEQVVQTNPYDQTSATQATVLRQLRRVVERGVSQEELQQILTQLRTMGRETQSSGVSAPPVPPVNHPLVPLQIPHLSEAPASSHAIPVPQAPVPSTSEASTSNAVPTFSGITNLFESLVKAGLVSANSTPRGAGQSTATPPPNISSQEKAFTSASSESELLDAQRSYAREILKMPIRLTTAEIGRNRPQNIPMLYDRMPLQCKQCALRFYDDSHGKAQMQEHLDSHFRQNRRAKETAGRGHCRSWFISVQDFVSEHSDSKGKGRALDAPSTVEVDKAKRDAELRASIVIVPAGEETKSITCPVCKESLRSEFLDEEEEWVWRNAIRVKDKISHATCHAEMTTSASLAFKLRTEEPANSVSSRSRTPERGELPKQERRSPKRETPEPSQRPMHGIKRKASETSDFNDPLAMDVTPPSKKAILSAA